MLRSLPSALMDGAYAQHGTTLLAAASCQALLTAAGVTDNDDGCVFAAAVAAAVAAAIFVAVVVDSHKHLGGEFAA